MRHPILILCLTLFLPGCLREARECTSAVNCFRQEACIKGMCVFEGLASADATVMPDMKGNVCDGGSCVEPEDMAKASDMRDANDMRDASDMRDVNDMSKGCQSPKMTCAGMCVPCPQGDGVTSTECKPDLSECIAVCKAGYESCDYPVAGSCCPERTSDRSVVVQSIESLQGGYIFSQLALDSTGQPHIAYRDTAPSDSDKTVRYTRLDAKTWSAPHDVKKADVGDRFSMILDPNDDPHLAFRTRVAVQDKKPLVIGHAWAKTGNWMEEEAATGQPDEGKPPVADYLRYPSLALAPNGTLYVVFQEKSTTGVKRIYYTYKRPGGSWGSKGTLAENTENLGDGHSFAIGTDGKAHLVYRANKELLYREFGRENDTLTLSNESRIDGTNDPGLGVILGLDTQGNPHVAYHRTGTVSTLCYASKDTATSWTPEVLPINGELEKQLGFALDSTGNPHISYSPASGGVFYTKKSGAGWLETPESVKGTGRASSLALDRFDRPHISYSEKPSSTGNLFFTYRRGGSWK